MHGPMISDYGIFSSPKRGVYIFGGIQGYDSMQNIFRFFEGMLQRFFSLKFLFFKKGFFHRDFATLKIPGTWLEN